MFDARAEPAPIEAITPLAWVVAVVFAFRKSGNVCGFDRMSKGFHEMWVEVTVQKQLPFLVKWNVKRVE